MKSENEKRSPNRLIHSTSPYLLQHAYNPVEWFEWGPEAIEKARNTNRPILVSIGYSSCHWCHVMERESFEIPEIASIMNEHLVCIKVDREERPDIDQVYMDAVQAMGLNGGWPLNVFLTPDQKPFYGGTYFPPKNWSQLVVQLAKAFHERRNEIDQSAADLTLHLNNSDLQRLVAGNGAFQSTDFDNTLTLLQSKFDPVFGGLDKAPKFIMPSIWMWLLKYHHLRQDKSSLEMILLTLRQVASGGIYDQIGGGFSRYAVDGRWFAPHFEKMLYDNAQLLSLYAEAYRVEPDPLFKKVIYEITDWLCREMKNPGGGFYSALDADSEGSEGKFYTWTSDELKEVLGDQYASFKSHFHVTEEGNWEAGRNILFQDMQIPEDSQLTELKRKLLRVRNERVHPGLDDKIVSGWNAMLVQGFLDAYCTFGDHLFLREAFACINFMEVNLLTEDRCYRTHKTRRSETEGFLEDYAYLIQAYISLYQCTFDEKWLAKAEKHCQYVDANFWDDKESFFFFSGAHAEKLIARKKEIFDNVIPSSNSLMARNLLHLGSILDREHWKQKAFAMVSALKKPILNEPTYMSNWGILALEIAHPFHEIVITGEEALEKRMELSKLALPFSVILGTTTDSKLPLVKGKTVKGKTLIYICRNKTCQLPVSTVSEALHLIRNQKTA